MPGYIKVYKQKTNQIKPTLPIKEMKNKKTEKQQFKTGKQVLTKIVIAV